MGVAESFAGVSFCTLLIVSTAAVSTDGDLTLTRMSGQAGG